MYPVWWTRIGRIDVRDGQPPAPGVCTVVVPVPDRTSPEASWPARPAAWRVHARPGWAAWHDPACAAAR
jgi:hypothetical protein